MPHGKPTKDFGLSAMARYIARPLTPRVSHIIAKACVRLLMEGISEALMAGARVKLNGMMSIQLVDRPPKRFMPMAKKGGTRELRMSRPTRIVKVKLCKGLMAQRLRHPDERVALTETLKQKPTEAQIQKLRLLSQKKYRTKKHEHHDCNTEPTPTHTDAACGHHLQGPPNGGEA